MLYNEGVLKSEEKAIFSLRALYKRYGYLPFKMSKFEEYDLYVRNKDFLICDNVITFNDTNGKLLALKPDVTLSIIKNTADEPGCKHKVYYNENVYRVSPSTHQFKEIMQTGIECIGDIDITDSFEVVYLAAKSLATVSRSFVIDIAHMGIFSALVDSITDNKMLRKEIAKCISEKNVHDLLVICQANDISDKDYSALSSLIELHGSPYEVIERLRNICKNDAFCDSLNEFSELCSLLAATEFAENIRIDFSVINNSSYYNGIVFKGFLSEICESVLSGGNYDPLMRRMGRKSSAVGFALYVDLLENIGVDKLDYDVDALILYSENTPTEKVLKVREELIKSGKSVSAQKKIPEKLRYKELVNLNEEGLR